MAATLTLESMPRFQTRQALVLLNLQTDFVTAEGKLHAPHPPDCVDRIKKLVPAFRDAGDVIWVRTEFETERAVNDAEGQAESVVTDDDLPAHEREEEEKEEEEEEEAPVVEATPDSPVHEPERTSTQPRSVSAPIRETFLSSTGSNREGGPVRCCERDTAGAAFAPAVVDCVRETGDSTFITSYYSAFNSTDLLSFLRGNFVTELYVCGAISNISVYATALDAVRHGYSVTLVHDCMAYRSEARHNEAVRQMTEFMGADLVTSDELARSLREDRPSASGPGAAIEADKDVFGVVDVGKASRLRPIETRSTDSAIALADDPSEAPAAPSATGKNSRAGSVTRRTSSRDVERPLEVRPHVPPKAADAPRPPLGRGASQPRSKTWPDPEVPGRDPSKDHDDDDDGDGDATSTDVTKATASEASEASPTTPTAATAATAATAERGRGSSAQPTPRARVARRIEMRSTPPPPPLGPDSKVGEGDSRIVHDILPARLRHGIFERLQDEVRFRPMYHRGGEVPRLVAAQGEIAEEGSIPVYRHPADESPPPSRFSHVVADIRDVVQKTLGHPINHVLIQRYRNGQDHITEHSDKTLDIVRGSSIANVSFGAQRTMVLRTKRSAFGPRPPSLPDRVASDGNVGNPENAGNAGRSAGRRAEQSAARSRRSQRVPMPHNSMFVLGPKTNTSWLHGIRPDRRPPTEKLEHELAYAGERISLTFRHVGTFLNPRTNRIWGQGAKSKRKEDAGAVVDGGGVESERMVNAFGRENQETDFDWDDAYGEGFDVVDVVATRPRLFLSRHRLSNVQVRLHLAELDVEYDERQPVPLDGTTSSPRLPSRPPTDEEDGAIRFVDRDVERAESVGVLPVIFYLERYYRDGGGGGGDGSNSATVTSPSSSSSSSSSYTRSEMATILTRSGLTHQLILCWERFGQVTTLPRPSSSSSSTFSSSTSTSTSSTMASSSFSSTSSTNADRVAAEKALHRELATWEDRASHYAHIGCHAYSVADSAFWPVLDDIVRKWADWDHHIFANLHRYHVALLARPAVRKVLRLAEAREVLHDAGPAVDKA